MAILFYPCIDVGIDESGFQCPAFYPPGGLDWQDNDDIDWQDDSPIDPEN